MLRWVGVLAFALYGCASEPPVTEPEPIAETKPPTAPIGATPPPACAEDTTRVFSPDGKYLALTHEAGGISIYDTSSWTLVASLATQKISGMFFAGRRFVFAEGIPGKEDLYRVQVLDESFRSLFELANALTGRQGERLALSEDGSQLLLPVLDSRRG